LPDNYNTRKEPAMPRLFNFLFKKYVKEVYKRGYTFGLNVGLELVKKLASNQLEIIGIDNKIQKDIEDIIESKDF
jgi:hypothetical protein